MMIGDFLLLSMMKKNKIRFLELGFGFYSIAQLDGYGGEIFYSGDLVVMMVLDEYGGEIFTWVIGGYDGGDND